MSDLVRALSSMAENKIRLQQMQHEQALRMTQMETEQLSSSARLAQADTHHFTSLAQRQDEANAHRAHQDRTYMAQREDAKNALALDKQRTDAYVENMNMARRLNELDYDGKKTGYLTDAGKKLTTALAPVHNNPNAGFEHRLHALNTVGAITSTNPFAKQLMEPLFKEFNVPEDRTGFAVRAVNGGFIIETLGGKNGGGVITKNRSDDPEDPVDVFSAEEIDAIFSNAARYISPHTDSALLAAMNVDPYSPDAPRPAAQPQAIAQPEQPAQQAAPSTTSALAQLPPALLSRSSTAETVPVTAAPVYEPTSAEVAGLQARRELGAIGGAALDGIGNTASAIRAPVEWTAEHVGKPLIAEAKKLGTGTERFFASLLTGKTETQRSAETGSTTSKEIPRVTPELKQQQQVLTERLQSGDAVGALMDAPKGAPATVEQRADVAALDKDPSRLTPTSLVYLVQSGGLTVPEALAINQLQGLTPEMARASNPSRAVDKRTALGKEPPSLEDLTKAKKGINDRLEALAKNHVDMKADPNTLGNLSAGIKAYLETQVGDDPIAQLYQLETIAGSLGNVVSYAKAISGDIDNPNQAALYTLATHSVLRGYRMEDSAALYNTIAEYQKAKGRLPNDQMTNILYTLQKGLPADTTPDKIIGHLPAVEEHRKKLMEQAMRTYPDRWQNATQAEMTETMKNLNRFAAYQYVENLKQQQK